MKSDNNVSKCFNKRVKSTDADKFYLSLSVSVFPLIFKKTDAARITKLDIEMFHREFWILIYFVVKGAKVKVTCHKNNAGVGLCTLESTGFF